MTWVVDLRPAAAVVLPRHGPACRGRKIPSCLPDLYESCGLRALFGIDQPDLGNT